MKKNLLGLTCALSLVALAGCCCRSGCRKPGGCPVPAGPVPLVAPTPFPGGPPPQQFSGGPPPGSLPPPNSPNPTPFPVAPPPNNPSPFPVAPPPATRSEFRWQPGPSPSHVQLLPPEFGDSAKLPPDLTGSKTTEPPLNDPFATLPVGIPGFAKVKDQIYVGQRPSLDDGLDWLKGNKFHRVLQVRPPGEDDSVDRKQVEQRGLKYVAIEISPKTLTRETVQEFAQILRDEAGYPLFVYDRDGALAGPMWYVYFRLGEQQSHDVSLIRAQALGLRTEGDGPHRDMWLAVQRILEK